MNHAEAPSTITTSSQSTVSATPPTGGSKRRLGRVVAGSLAAGLVTGVLLVFVPFVPAGEAGATGELLFGFAFGWVLMALLSVRFTDQPQRWAFAPAAFMGLGGLILIAFGSPAHHVLSWVWPPALLTITVWMVVQTRRQTLSTGARVLLYPVFAFLALASIGGGIETVLEAVDTARYPMAGEVVDVDGHGMHLSCTGTGSPTVVLEPGGGELSSNLGWITPAVARDTRVCVYDRPGRGWSDPTDTPQDGSRVAANLHTLLHAAHVPGPYLLAGHSFGGLYVLTYAAHYPDDVSGMVLIDSTSPTTPAPQTVAPRAASDGPVARGSSLVSVVARFGLGRLYSLTSYGSLPTQSRDEVRATISTAPTLRSTIDEYAQASTSMQEAAELRDFGAKPLVVLTAGDGSDAGWFAQQDKLAQLSTNTVHRVVAGASHGMLVGDQTASASTIAAIRDVVSAIRSGSPLAR
jgi:pimeloyl-ACP methyl ester carboxylesterase